MRFDWGMDPKTLASKFGSFLRDPKTIGGGYRARTGENSFTYQIEEYVIEGDFLDEDRCKVKVTNGLSIEEILEVSYVHATEPDFLKLFTETCILANILANSE